MSERGFLASPLFPRAGEGSRESVSTLNVSPRPRRARDKLFGGELGGLGQGDERERARPAQTDAMLDSADGGGKCVPRASLSLKPREGPRNDGREPVTGRPGTGGRQGTVSTCFNQVAPCRSQGV